MSFGGFNTAFSFGTAAATSAPSVGFNFGTPISSTQASITTPFSLSTQPVQTAAFNLSMQPTTSQSTGLFGTTGTSLSSAGLFNPGTTISTLPTLSTGLTLGLGNFGFSTSNTTTSTTTTNVLANTVATSSRIGLGGVNLLESNQPSNASSSTFNIENKSVKDSQVDELIANLVSNFSKYIKEQKMTRDNISHWSASAISNVGNDVKIMTSSLHNLKAMMQSLGTDVNRLKITSKQDVANVEIAQRTHSLPKSHQYENILPMRYFQNLASSFEERMTAYRHEILVVEEFIQHISDNHTLSPQEFGEIFKKISVGFIELSAQIQTLCESVKELKSNFYKYRSQIDGKNFIGTTSFEVNRSPLQVLNENRTISTIGPSIFTGGSSKLANSTTSPQYSPLFLNATTIQNQTPTFNQNTTTAFQTPLFQSSTATPSLFGGGNLGSGTTGTGIFGNTGSGGGGLFGNTSINTGNTSFTGFGSPSSFGATAQKSSGNKRGKNN